VAAEHRGDRERIRLEHDDLRFPQVHARFLQWRGDRLMTYVAERGREPDRERSRILPQAFDEVTSGLDRRIRLHRNDRVFAEEMRKRREIAIERPAAHHVRRQQQLGRDGDRMRVAGALIQIRVSHGAPAADAVRHRDRRLNHAPFLEDSLHRARGSIGARAGRGVDDDLDRFVGLPFGRRTVRCTCDPDRCQHR
jgi:hypothetical protein